MSRPPLLFLAHRIPYPPNKGDKVRSFHALKHLAQHFDVRLAAFVDDPADWQHAGRLGEWCSRTLLRPLRPTLARLAATPALVTGEPITCRYFRDREIARWVRHQLDEERVRHVLVYSSGMAGYVRGLRPGAVRRVVDMVDVDSQKWHAYGAARRSPAGWVYSREARRLLAFERAVADEFDATVLVSEPEAALFRRLAPEAAHRVTHIDNGVDSEYFSPDDAHPRPYPRPAPVLVFTGAMDYWANVDAVVWFANEVFPAVRARVPAAEFWIVGARPTEAVRRLERIDGVHVTGAVADVRPYLAHARAAVAPLRIARGVQNKVLEAFAMARPVIATPQAMEGIALDAPLERLVTDDPAHMAQLAAALLAPPGGRPGDVPDGDALGRAGLALVRSRHRWETNMRKLEGLLH